MSMEMSPIFLLPACTIGTVIGFILDTAASSARRLTGQTFQLLSTLETKSVGSQLKPDQRMYGQGIRMNGTTPFTSAHNRSPSLSALLFICLICRTAPLEDLVHSLR